MKEYWDWRGKVEGIVVAASARDEQAWKWIRRVRAFGTEYEDFAFPHPKFETLDMKIKAAGKAICTGIQIFFGN